MAAGTPPLRWLIGTELARYRAEAGLSLVVAANKAGVTKDKIQNLELGRQIQDPEDIAEVLNAYGVPARDVDRLTTLTGRADESMWWAPWKQVVPDWLRTYVGLEALAERAFTFQALVIPGLLQTSEYTAAITATSRSIRPDHGERFVAFRAARAKRLTDPERPLRLHAVITDGALRLAVGTPDVRRDQLKHLIAMAELPNVDIQVLRPEDGPHSALAGGFVQLDFDNTVRPVVYVELKDGAVYLQAESDVEAYTQVSRDLRQAAMSPEQSRGLLGSLLKSV